MEKELEELEQEELDKDLLGVGTSTHELPEVPSGDIKEPAAASKEKKKGKLTRDNVKITFSLVKCFDFFFFFVSSFQFSSSKTS